MIHGLTEAGELRTLEEAIRIGTALQYCWWFRGHSKIVGMLSPGAIESPSAPRVKISSIGPDSVSD
jgi:hypothetical protein